MREQAVASRGSRRASGPARDFVQRPARRDSRTTGRPRSVSLRSILNYVPAVLKMIAAILVLVTIIVGYRAAASAALFQVRNVDVSGTSQTSAEEIQSLVRRAAARTGVWRADLAGISAELARLPGIRRAVITRVLPDRLRVRVTERLPIAVVRTSAGHFVWVDDEGVTMREMQAIDSMPPFFIRGWTEDSSDDANLGNIERVQKYLELAREWQSAGILDRVSEVNLVDIRDIRAQLAGDDSQIEVRLGSQDPGQRLKSALEVLDKYKQTPNGSSITYVDSQGGRVTLGYSSGNKINAGSSNASTPKAGLAIVAAPAAQKATSNNANRNSNGRKIPEDTLAKTSSQKPSRSSSPRDDKNSERPRRALHD